MMRGILHDSRCSSLAALLTLVDTGGVVFHAAAAPGAPARAAPAAAVVVSLGAGAWMHGDIHSQ